MSELHGARDLQCPTQHNPTVSHLALQLMLQHELYLVSATTSMTHSDVKSTIPVPSIMLQQSFTYTEHFQPINLVIHIINPFLYQSNFHATTYFLFIVINSIFPSPLCNYFLFQKYKIISLVHSFNHTAVTNNSQSLLILTSEELFPLNSIKWHRHLTLCFQGEPFSSYLMSYYLHSNQCIFSNNYRQ